MQLGAHGDRVSAGNSHAGEGRARRFALAPDAVSIPRAHRSRVNVVASGFLEDDTYALLIESRRRKEPRTSANEKTFERVLKHGLALEEWPPAQVLGGVLHQFERRGQI